MATMAMGRPDRAQQPLGDGGGEGGGADIDQGDAHQQRHQQLVRLAEQGGQWIGLGALLLREVLEPRAAQREVGRLGAGEQRRAEHERDEKAELEEQEVIHGSARSRRGGSPARRRAPTQQMSGVPASISPITVRGVPVLRRKSVRQTLHVGGIASEQELVVLAAGGGPLRRASRPSARAAAVGAGGDGQPVQGHARRHRATRGRRGRGRWRARPSSRSWRARRARRRASGPPPPARAAGGERASPRRSPRRAGRAAAPRPRPSRARRAPRPTRPSVPVTAMASPAARLRSAGVERPACSPSRVTSTNQPRGDCDVSPPTIEHAVGRRRRPHPAIAGLDLGDGRCRPAPRGRRGPSAGCRPWPRCRTGSPPSPSSRCRRASPRRGGSARPRPRGRWWRGGRRPGSPRARRCRRRCPRGRRRRDAPRRLADAADQTQLTQPRRLTGAPVGREPGPATWRVSGLSITAGRREPCPGSSGAGPYPRW